MIINICGTSGSGKSTAVRAVMDLAPEREAVRSNDGRKQPIGYTFHLPDVRKPVFVPGHYEAVTGGCDTIKDIPRIFRLVKDFHLMEFHVLYEGLFVMNMTRGPEMVREFPGCVVVFRLDTHITECKRGVNARRAEQGEPPLTTWKNTEGHVIRARNYTQRMDTAGARTHLVSRDEVVSRVLEVMRV
jgi:energy-coupling factor transporter ATP-binding protein EcfA2